MTVSRVHIVQWLTVFDADFSGCLFNYMSFLLFAYALKVLKISAGEDLSCLGMQAWPRAAILLDSQLRTLLHVQIFQFVHTSQHLPRTTENQTFPS